MTWVFCDLLYTVLVHNGDAEYGEGEGKAT